MLQEALAKLIDFRIFLFSLSFLLKEARFEQFLILKSLLITMTNTIHFHKNDETFALI